MHSLPVQLALTVLMGVVVTTASADDAEERELFEGAERVIETVRKADARITLTDAKGNPLAGWKVQVRLRRHAFLFGGAIALKTRVSAHQEKAYREAFDQFDVEKIAAYGEPEKDRLLSNSGIIRNRAKVEATITNAQAFLEVRNEHGSFDAYIWQFVDGAPVTNNWTELSEIPAHTAQSEAMSKDLKKKDFKFVGPTICYAFMQAVGMVNDHSPHCFRWRELQN